MPATMREALGRAFICPQWPLPFACLLPVCAASLKYAKLSLHLPSEVPVYFTMAGNIATPVADGAGPYREERRKARMRVGHSALGEVHGPSQRLELPRRALDVAVKSVIPEPQVERELGDRENAGAEAQRRDLDVDGALVDSLGREEVEGELRESLVGPHTVLTQARAGW
jgi:hypothetical protein